MDYQEILDPAVFLELLDCLALQEDLVVKVSLVRLVSIILIESTMKSVYAELVLFILSVRLLLLFVTC